MLCEYGMQAQEQGNLSPDLDTALAANATGQEEIDQLKPCLLSCPLGIFSRRAIARKDRAGMVSGLIASVGVSVCRCIDAVRPSVSQRL